MLIDESPEQALKEYDIAGNLAEVLIKHYPAHLWGVNVDLRGGIVQVTNMRLSGRWGFVLLLKDVLADTTNRLIINAGGELLERYRMKRTGFDEAQYENLKTDKLGDFIAEK